MFGDQPEAEDLKGLNQQNRNEENAKRDPDGFFYEPCSKSRLKALPILIQEAVTPDGLTCVPKPRLKEKEEGKDNPKPFEPAFAHRRLLI